MEAKAKHYLAWCSRERRLNEPVSPPRRRRSLSNPPPPSHHRSPSAPRPRRSTHYKSPLSHRRSLSEPGGSKRRWYFLFRKRGPAKPSPGSPLLLLPPELREKIFHEVIGGKIIHLIQLRKRLGHLRCNISDSDREQEYHRRRECVPESKRQTYWAGEPPVHRDDELSDDGGIALLQTCRQIYRECIGLLYANNVFDINHPQTLLFLARTILPQRLAAIRTLQVSFPGTGLPRGYGSIIDPRLQEPDRLGTWIAMCDVITTQMTGLKNLTLGFERVHPFNWNGDMQEVPREDVQMLLQYLCALRGLQKFDIKIYPASWDIAEFADELTSLFKAEQPINVIGSVAAPTSKRTPSRGWKRQSVSEGWKRMSRDFGHKLGDLKRFSIM